jgi:Thrombospondin type 3 repeat
MLAARMLLVLVLALAVTAPSASAAVVPVHPGSLGGWQLTTSPAAASATVGLVDGVGTPPLGAGSARLAMGSDGSQAAMLRYPGYAGVPATEFDELSYSTYVESGGTNAQAPYLMLQVDFDNNASTTEDLWFFEPIYQTATYFPSYPQPSLAPNVWQTWDARRGGWYSVFGTAGSGPGTNVVSYDTLAASDPDARIVNSSGGQGGLRVAVGFGDNTTWANRVMHADALRVKTTVGAAVSDTTYDFETDTDGDGLAGGYDNCPGTANPDQADLDGSGGGDVCDPDDDGDGVPDADDAFPRDPTRSAPDPPAVTPDPPVVASQPPAGDALPPGAAVTPGDTLPPGVTVTRQRGRLSLRRLRRILALGVATTEPASLQILLLRGARTIASRNAPAAGTTPRRIRLRVPRSLRPLRRGVRLLVRVIATDAAGNTTVREMRVRLFR